MDDNRFAETAKNGKPSTPGLLDSLQNVAAKVGHQITGKQA